MHGWSQCMRPARTWTAAREKRRVEERKLREGSMAGTVASWVPAGVSEVGVDIRSRLGLAF